MDTSTFLTPGLAEQYREKFGEEGAFDTGLFSPMVTMALMAEALRRERAVDREDLEAMHQQLYRQPLPESGVPLEPSGYGVVLPPPEPVFPSEWTAVPPPPLEPEAPPESREHRETPKPPAPPEAPEPSPPPEHRPERGGRRP